MPNLLEKIKACSAEERRTIAMEIAKVSEPDYWLKFTDGNKVFYADPFVVKESGGEPLRKVNYHECHLILQGLGLRTLTDREYNIMVDENADIAKDMIKHIVWTGYFKKIEMVSQGYVASYIARPEIRKKDDFFEFVGTEKKVRLPTNGWFKISELMESEIGLPEKTYWKMPDEPFAVSWMHEGVDIPVIRKMVGGLNEGQRHFNIAGIFHSYSCSDGIGMRAASDEKPIIYHSITLKNTNPLHSP